MAEVGDKTYSHRSSDRKGSSYHDKLFLCERLFLEEHYVQLGAVALWGCIGFLPVQRWDPNPRGLFFCSLPQCLLLPSRGTSISNSNGNLASEMPRALIYFIGIFVFSKAACCSDPQSHTLFLPSSVRKEGTMPSGV